MKKLFALLLALVMALSLVACGEKKDDTGDKTDDSNPSTGMELTQATDLVIATGGTSGAWYPIGVSIADTLTNVDNNLFVTSEVTNGGVENARLLGTHAANVGFVNSDTAYFATHSEDAFASEPAYEVPAEAKSFVSVELVLKGQRKNFRRFFQVQEFSGLIPILLCRDLLMRKSLHSLRTVSMIFFLERRWLQRDLIFRM